MFEVTRHGIELADSDIAFSKTGSTIESVEDWAQCMFGSTDLTNMVTIKKFDSFFVCDGVNPSTGTLFSPEVLQQLNEIFGAENVTLH